MAFSRDRLPADLQTTRLRLVTPALAHVPAMAALANNARIHRVLARLPHSYTEADGRFFVETIARGPEEFAWAIAHEEQFIGVMGLHLVAGQLPELGYWLGEPFWGRGFATEAGLAVVAAARAAGATALRSRALSANAASRNVLRKLGFVEFARRLEDSGNQAGQPTTYMRLDFPS